ncbi:MAG: hypothetical protein ACI8TF_001096 [Paracoccaceae bacterium]|jgi:hypothetical protein
MMTQSPSNIALRAVLALAGVAIIFLGLNVGLGGGGPWVGKAQQGF